MKLLYRLMLMLCLLLTGMGAIGLSHAAHRSTATAQLGTTDLTAVSGTQGQIRQLVIKACNPGGERQANGPRALIAEDNDTEDDDRDERFNVSVEVPVALPGFSFTVPAVAYCPESVACMPARCRHFSCPTMGRRLALLRVFRL